MSEEINAVEKVVTRVARNESGQYLLKDGTALDIYDPSLKGKYQTKTFITYNTYTMTGVTEVVEDTTQLRQMTLGQLVMALCLQRATTVESRVVELMEDIAENTAQINALSTLESKLANCNDGASWVKTGFRDCSTYTSEYGDILGLDMTADEMTLFREYSEQGYGLSVQDTDWWCDWLRQVVSGTSIQTSYYSEGGYYIVSSTNVQKAVSAIDSKLDSLNSLSQELLIELQSQTSKRDQAYDMVSGILKSMNTTLTGNAQNI